MSDFLIKEETLKEIGDAIRQKTNSSASIQVTNLASEINSIGQEADVEAEHILSGKKAYDGSQIVTGTIIPQTASSLSANGATVTVPAGYYSTEASKTISSGSAKTPTSTITRAPSIEINSSGLITTSFNGTQDITPTVKAGYISSGTAGTITVTGSSTKQLTTQAAKTITPTSSNQTAVGSNVYTTGQITVAGDSNLIPENIRSGKSIFGISGTCGDIITVTDSGTQLSQSFSNPIRGFVYKSSNTPTGWTIAINGSVVYQLNTSTNIRIMVLNGWCIITDLSGERVASFIENIPTSIESVKIKASSSVTHNLYYIK